MLKLKKIMVAFILVLFAGMASGFVGTSYWALEPQNIYAEQNEQSAILSNVLPADELLVVERNDNWSKVYCKETKSFGYTKTATLSLLPIGGKAPARYVDHTDQTNIIRIGDSRIDQMYNSISETERAKSSWISEPGAGFPWLMGSVVPTIDSLPSLENKVIIIQLGVNDIIFRGEKYARENYSNFNNTKAVEWMNRGAIVVYNEVWPIVRDKATSQKVAALPEEDFTSYNTYIESKLGNNKNVLSLMYGIKNGLVGKPTTTDGLHYTKDYYASIFAYENRILNIP